MSSTQALTRAQCNQRLAFGFCPVCFSSRSGLRQLSKRVVKDHDDHSFKGAFWVCTGNPNHEHYYLSEGGASSGPRERKGAALPTTPVETPYVRRVIRR